MMVMMEEAKNCQIHLRPADITIQSMLIVAMIMMMMIMMMMMMTMTIVMMKKEYNFHICTSEPSGKYNTIYIDGCDDNAEDDYDDDDDKNDDDDDDYGDDGGGLELPDTS
jgi:hypothetical protein